ncbi:MAG TPA: hypothetical protein VN944_09785 [Nitrospiria bacterium]|nr:hypothetical protein [Nitrospiria bacterium]
MKKLTLVLTTVLFLSSLSLSARGEDVTLLLTVRSEVNDAPVKIDLRLGLWKEGLDGLDPLDTRAMENGQFDAWFELPPAFGETVPARLWWDIRSRSPEQVWTLQIVFPQKSPVFLDWKMLGVPGDLEKLSFVVVEPESGHETYLNQSAGSLSLISAGQKRFMIRSQSK